MPDLGAQAVFIALTVLLALAAGWLVHGVLSRRRVQALEAANRHLRSITDGLNDGSERANAELAALQRAQAELLQADRLATLGKLVAGVAHEVNTPLGALHSNHDVLRRALKRLADILADEVVDETELEELRRVVRAIDGILETNELAVERMVQIVDSLRTFGRVDRSELDLVDPRDGIESTLTLLRHQLQDRIAIVREYGDIPPIECYPNQLNQLFMNLLQNAAQAIPGQGTITIRTASAGDSVRLEFHDDGSGIAEENLGRIFDPGFTTKAGRVGMGLGLLISHQIVERHHGSIRVSSRVGEGSTFTLVLPVRLPEPARATATSEGGSIP